MAYRKRSSREDEDGNYGAMRQNLPRRCKANQPFYGIDNLLDDEDFDKFSKTTLRNGHLGSSSSRALEMRRPEEGLQVPKKTTIFSWLIDMKVVNENTTVSCFRSTHLKAPPQGRITVDGVFCYCCSKTFSPFEFPRHIRNYIVNEPFENVFVGGTNVSLLSCLIEAWNRHSLPAKNGYCHVVKRPSVRDHHDDCCLICADGGDLMCCERCPSTYHPRCLGFEGVPQGEWSCPYCRCKYCDRMPSTDLLLTCVQCLKKYHWICSERYDSIPPTFQSSSVPFCGRRCWQVYMNLEGIIRKPIPIQPATLSWTLVRRMDMDATAQHNADLHMRVTCNSLVAVAAQLMENCFSVMVDRQTRANLIHNVVYSCGSNFTRTNFSRFYTAVLLWGGTVVTVASVRIPSPDVAEIPFIATVQRFRSFGMCDFLLMSLQKMLSDIGVERMIIPCAEDKVMKWEQKFEYRPLDQTIRRQITTLNTLMFPRTVRLQKIIRPLRREVVNDLNTLPPEAEDFHDGAV